MKTWRERIADREPGLRLDAMSYQTCACAEAARVYGVDVVELGHTFVSVPATVSVNHAGAPLPLGGLFPNAFRYEDELEPNWALAEWCLDQIEDRALELKREKS